MKKIIITLLTLLSVNASAFMPTIDLLEGDRSLVPLSGEVSVTHPTMTCPPEAHCAITTEVSIDYSLFGCLDRFASFHSVIRNYDGSIDVFVTAMNISNRDSIVAFCKKMPIHRQRIFIGTGAISEDDINVHFIGAPENIYEADLK